MIQARLSEKADFAGTCHPGRNFWPLRARSYGGFQRDLLGQHDVSDRQIAHRQKTQPKRRTAVSIDLADVRRGARIDPVPLAGVAADEIARNPDRL